MSIAVMSTAVLRVSPAAAAGPAADRTVVQAIVGRCGVTRVKAVKLRVRTVRVAKTGIAWARVGKGRPLLLLNGTGSPMSEWDPELLAERIAAAIPRASLILYLGAGHSFLFQQPRLVARNVVAFLDKPAAAAPISEIRVTRCG